MKELKFHGKSIIIGENSIEYIKNIDFKRVFIVTGGRSMFENGAIDKLMSILKEKSAEVHIFKGVNKNPTTEVVKLGVEEMKKFNPDTVIGIGGGSPIDAAKSMALFYEYDLDIEKVEGITLPQVRYKTKFIAVPSTSGTGTEVTRASVITYKDKDIKIGLKSDAFIPDYAILDSTLTYSMPKEVVAETGMDALTHAVECYINKNIDEFTEVLAEGAVKGIFKYLVLSYNGDKKARDKVHKYQCMAGCAFSNVGLGMAHGISHAIGGKYNLSHGLLNAICLPYVLKYNSRDFEVDQRLNYLASLIGSDSFINSVIDLNKSLNIPLSFKDLGIDENDFFENIEEITSNSLKGSTRVNPVKVSFDEMKNILKCIFYGDMGL
ncbi:iron-containing alcohol dehydrogenase [Thermobrachium celere]|uniref:Alcohol dehydrogenase n=1 Tax=Thermobrachium celere DSM 8682 TaxID=941824 RepID=R7RMB6_9CLOT|nr:iron-containing alcohol dehydrogenase [Thermobrachium celere]GFR36603.1 NADPH-dependent butanol dehydrogenase [Thermobrachium celere]CDF57169.1 Alcohol dehydrogenase [Thermobrachium celere DSM 8682]